MRNFVDERKRYSRLTLGGLDAHWVLYGDCARCPNIGYIDRWELARRFGHTQRMKPLETKLFCRRCGNKEFNCFTVAPMQR
ncbi:MULTISPECIES: hypothetical protein [unclassified Ensifer]|uniref:hypothetical protein n=1 Tax=unclassified Ensifer TaxID=2633371 RepID=UPI00081301E2|nr:MULTISPECIES: hypothetical protein [unclassified Ensifer]OCP17405.1 hypothetical protein BC361_08070 [Ensifer sp. LC54]OCP28689.1 hypothetical protein BC363_02285 [Ensifer sp. LC384]